MDRIEEEVALLRKRYPAGVERVGAGPVQVYFGNWQLPPGWSATTTWLMVLVPPGYPTTPPDNFYTAPDLKLANGNDPGSTSAANVAGKQVRQFSFHLVEAADWRPHATVANGHNLMTFMLGVERRLLEGS